MSLKKRLTAMGIIVIAAALTFGIAKSGLTITEKQEDTVFLNGKESLYLWYTDESLTSYLSSAAVTYNETHEVRVVPVLASGLEYLEEINRSSLEGNIPDLYILSHDSLEKAYLAGLACEIEPGDRVLLDEEYMGTGLQAVAYKDKILGYPFYFETSSLLYNRTYLEDMAKSQLEVEAEAAEDPQFTQEQIDAKVQELLPETIEEIRTLADNYDAPEQVEGVFKWDVTDIFYNYFFIGDTINMGGEAGWDTSQIDIYNEDAVRSLTAYQELSQFFSIDTDESDYQKILDEFISGKMVFTVATSDAVFKLEDARADGLLPYDYGVIQMPDIDADTRTRSLSMTSCVAINGYSQNKEAANDFAYYLTTKYNDLLYARAGKVPAAKNVEYVYEELYEFAAEYEESISMPKMIETSNFWVQLERAFAQIWNGEDVTEKLQELSEQITGQMEQLDDEAQTA